MVHGKNRIPYWIDLRLTSFAGPDDDATISFGLPFEPEDSQYGNSRPLCSAIRIHQVVLLLITARHVRSIWEMWAYIHQKPIALSHRVDGLPI